MMNSSFLYHAWGLYDHKSQESSTKVIQLSYILRQKIQRKHVLNAVIGI